MATKKYNFKKKGAKGGGVTIGANVQKAATKPYP